MLHLVNYKCLNHAPDAVWGQMFPALYFHHRQQSSTAVTLAATSVEHLLETLHSMLYHDA